MVVGLGCLGFFLPLGENAQPPALNIKFAFIRSPGEPQSRSRTAPWGTGRRRLPSGRPGLLGGRAMIYSCLQPNTCPTGKKIKKKEKKRKKRKRKIKKDSFKKTDRHTERNWDFTKSLGLRAKRRGLVGAKVNRQVKSYISKHCCSGEAGRGEITWKDENRTCASDDPIRCEVLQEIHI